MSQTVSFVELIRDVPELDFVLLDGRGRLIAHDSKRAVLEDRQADGDVIYRKRTQVYEYEGVRFKVSGTVE